MFQRVEKQLLSLLKESIESSCCGTSQQPAFYDILNSLTLEVPKEKEFGDFSCNVALRLASLLRKNPKSVALDIVCALKKLSSEIKGDAFVKDAEVKGAGFINIFLKEKVFFDYLALIHDSQEQALKLDLGRGTRVLLEFVSANPTGSLSVAHARQAAVGDALANCLVAAGYDVTREYYLNDEGNQVNILGSSILLRYRELGGEKIEFPEDHYQGTYITDLARELFDDKALRLKIEKLSAPDKELFFSEHGTQRILDIIKKELDDFGVRFDVWYSQKELGKSGKIESTLEGLKKKGFIYEAEGAVWFKSTEFGDDKDRVVRKSDGGYTYLAPDIAYHEDKFRRGFKKLINLWGPDHHGYIPRMKAAVRALGKDAEDLSVIIVQLATLFRKGVPVPMSTRKGQYVTLREVLTEVGRDASRFFFLMRKTDSHLDFDLELAKKQTSENPVYYVQYAHARISSILAGAQDKKFDTKEPDLLLLKEPEERDLLKAIFEFSYCLFVCVKQLDPYGLTLYLQYLSGVFHRFYDRHKVLSPDDHLTQARLYLIGAVKIELACGLRILGVSSPERM
ncbi:MAG: arginine--tRNA ligase [Candidatus Omnitrophota bacterium]